MKNNVLTALVIAVMAVMVAIAYNQAVGFIVDWAAILPLVLSSVLILVVIIWQVIKKN